MEAYKQTAEYAEYRQRFETDKLIRTFAAQLGITKAEFRQFPSDPNAPKRPNTSFFWYVYTVFHCILICTGIV